MICEHTIISKPLTKKIKNEKALQISPTCGSSEQITLAVTCQWPWPKGSRNLLYFTTSQHFLAPWIHLVSSPEGHCLHLTQYVKAFQLLKPNCQIFSSCWGMPCGSIVKNSPATRRLRFDPWVRKIPWKRKWQSTLVFLPGKSHRQTSLAGYSPWGHSQTWLSD